MADSFKEFINKVQWLGGEWNSNDVYFSQVRDGYMAVYEPQYPLNCKDDKIINCHFDYTSIAKQRGRYEFIKFYPEEDKCRSVYVNTLEDLLQAVNGNI